MKKLDITPYEIEGDGISSPMTLVLVTDLHNCEAGHVTEAIRKIAPDAVIIAGDMMSQMTPARHSSKAMRFLRETSKLCPVFYGLGNHEKHLSKEERNRIRETGVTLLYGEYVHFGELCIGAAVPEHYEEPSDIAFLEAFEKEDGFRVLISHRPELYKRYLHKYDIPLIVSGHAHGGQVRIFTIPVFAPGQGLFPRYAQGMHENRLIVSRGLGNHTVCPRFFNRAELCVIKIKGKECQQN